jgi:hypothetical protein
LLYYLRITGTGPPPSIRDCRRRTLIYAHQGSLANIVRYRGELTGIFHNLHKVKTTHYELLKCKSVGSNRNPVVGHTENPSYTQNTEIVVLYSIQEEDLVCNPQDLFLL